MVTRLSTSSCNCSQISTPSNAGHSEFGKKPKGHSSILTPLACSDTVGRMNLRFLRPLALSCLLVGTRFVDAVDSAPVPNKALAEQAIPLLQEFCIRYHGEQKAKAHLNLERIGSPPSFVTDFKTWEKVIAMLGEKEM